MILEMPSLFTKLKSNNYVVSTNDLILIMIGWFSNFRIAFTSWSPDNLFEIHHYFNVKSLSYVVKVIKDLINHSLLTYCTVIVQYLLDSLNILLVFIRNMIACYLYPKKQIRLISSQVSADEKSQLLIAN